MTATRDQFVKSAKLSADAKSKHTSSILSDILDSEAAAKERRTQKRRALQLAQQVAAADTSRSET